MSTIYRLGACGCLCEPFSALIRHGAIAEWPGFVDRVSGATDQEIIDNIVNGNQGGQTNPWTIDTASSSAVSAAAVLSEEPHYLAAIGKVEIYHYENYSETPTVQECTSTYNGYTVDVTVAPVCVDPEIIYGWESACIGACGLSIDLTVNSPEYHNSTTDTYSCSRYRCEYQVDTDQDVTEPAGNGSYTYYIIYKYPHESHNYWYYESGRVAGEYIVVHVDAIHYTAREIKYEDTEEHAVISDITTLVHFPAEAYQKAYYNCEVTYPGWTITRDGTHYKAEHITTVVCDGYPSPCSGGPGIYACTYQERATYEITFSSPLPLSTIVSDWEYLMSLRTTSDMLTLYNTLKSGLHDPPPIKQFYGMTLAYYDINGYTHIGQVVLDQDGNWTVNEEWPDEFHHGMPFDGDLIPYPNSLPIGAVVHALRAVTWSVFSGSPGQYATDCATWAVCGFRSYVWDELWNEYLETYELDPTDFILRTYSYEELDDDPPTTSDTDLGAYPVCPIFVMEPDDWGVVAIDPMHYTE